MMQPDASEKADEKPKKSLWLRILKRLDSWFSAGINWAIPRYDYEKDDDYESLTYQFQQFSEVAREQQALLLECARNSQAYAIENLRQTEEKRQHLLTWTMSLIGAGAATPTFLGVQLGGWQIAALGIMCAALFLLALAFRSTRVPGHTQTLALANHLTDCNLRPPLALVAHDLDTVTQAIRGANAYLARFVNYAIGLLVVAAILWSFGWVISPPKKSETDGTGQQPLKGSDSDEAIRAPILNPQPPGVDPDPVPGILPAPSTQGAGP